MIRTILRWVLTIFMVGAGIPGGVRLPSWFFRRSKAS